MSDNEYDSAEQDPTDGSSAKPSVPPMALFRLCLEEIDAEMHDALRQHFIWLSQGLDATARDYMALRKGLEKAKSILLKHMKEASSHDETGGRSS